MDNNIELQNVSKKYKDFELKNISFNVPQGCIVGLIGENGAGKTTTIKRRTDKIVSGRCKGYCQDFDDNVLYRYRCKPAFRDCRTMQRTCNQSVASIEETYPSPEIYERVCRQRRTVYAFILQRRTQESPQYLRFKIRA